MLTTTTLIMILELYFALSDIFIPQPVRRAIANMHLGDSTTNKMFIFKLNKKLFSFSNLIIRG